MRIQWFKFGEQFEELEGLAMKVTMTELQRMIDNVAIRGRLYIVEGPKASIALPDRAVISCS